jgi:hypothetical protein
LEVVVRGLLKWIVKNAWRAGDSGKKVKLQHCGPAEVQEPRQPEGGMASRYSNKHAPQLKHRNG